MLIGGLIGKQAAAGMSAGMKKVVAPGLLKMLQSENFANFADALNNNAQNTAGINMLSKGVEDLFIGQSLVGEKLHSNYKNVKERDKLDEYIGKGGINQNLQEQVYEGNAEPAPSGPLFAEGGEVTMPVPPVPSGAPDKNVAPLLQQNPGLGVHYPEQNMLTTALKGRVSQYLSGLKPDPNPPRLAFEDPPDIRAQTKSYQRALDIAIHPLGVLKEIKQGTIEPDHIKHLNSMYPELVGLMGKHITQKITEQQLKGQKPGYVVRQGLSMLLQTPLSPELKPGNIQAAQQVFQRQKAGQQQMPPAGSPRKSDTKSLTKSDQAFLTGGQALARRGQRAK
jgi:hypothetical protein